MPNNFIYYLFVFLIIFTPLAFGTVEGWSLAIMEIFSVSSLALFMVQGLKKREKLFFVPGILPLILFLLYILFQIIPLPFSIVKMISPAAAAIHQHALDISENSWITISVHPKVTVSEFFRFTSYVFFYVLTVQLLKNRFYLKTTVIIITIFGALLSFSSILQFYLTDDMAMWFRHVPKNSMIVGPYICHNHYAGLMEMIFPIVLAFFFFHRPRLHNSSIFKSIIEILGQEKANIHILIGGAALLIITSIFVSLSRGGIISLSLSLIFFIWLIFKRKISQGNTFLIMGIMLLTAMSVGWFGWDQIFERFARLKDAQGVIYNSRFDFWKDSIPILINFPLTGSGLGTFFDIFPTFQMLHGYLDLAHAHNDYIELAAEGGAIAFFLAAAFMVTLFIKTYKVFLTRRDAYSVYLYMGSITAILAILIHSFVDFNLHIGANGLWFFFMAGLAVSAANTGVRSNSIATRLPYIKSEMIKRISVGLVLFILPMTFLYHFSNLVGRYYFSHITNLKITSKSSVSDLKAIENIADHAIGFDPMRAEYFFAKANASLYLKKDFEARQNFEKSVRLNPANSHYLKRYAQYMAGKGNFLQAEKLFADSIRSDISNAELHLEFGVWLLSQKRKDEGLAYVKKAVVLKGELIDRALTAMAILRLSDQDMEKIVPESPGPYITWAGFLYSMGKRELAEKKYIQSLKYIETQKKINKWHYYQVKDFFKKRGKNKEALAVMQKAAAVLPLDAGIRVSIGDIYRDMKIDYRAVQEYENALFIDPQNREARHRLKQMNSQNLSGY